MGPYRGTVQRAEQDRNEILRMVSSLPPSDQSLVDGVIPATEALLPAHPAARAGDRSG